MLDTVRCVQLHIRLPEVAARRVAQKPGGAGVRALPLVRLAYLACKPGALQRSQRGLQAGRGGLDSEDHQAMRLA